MTSNPGSGILKTPSTFQPRQLDSESLSSSNKSEKHKVQSEFPPPAICSYQSPQNAMQEKFKRSCWNSHNLVGFIFFNLLALALLFPLITVSFVVYCLPEIASLHQNLIPGFNLTKIQLIGLFAFVSMDLLVYFLVYYAANYSLGFEGCSTGLHYKIFNGTQFIPMIIVVKLLQPLAVVGSDGGDVDMAVVWIIRIFICILLMTFFFPLLSSEIKLIRSIGQISLPSSPVTFGQDPLLQYAAHFRHFQFDSESQRKKDLNDRRLPAYLFLALKLSIIFFFLLEVAVINLGSFSPITLDYPLILSVANLVFIYYSHQSIIVKYNILDLKKTAITQEYSCLDGQHCTNRFRSNFLMSYEATEKTFLLPSTVNYSAYSLGELPKWLKRAIRRRIATFT